MVSVQRKSENWTSRENEIVKEKDERVLVKVLRLAVELGLVEKDTRRNNNSNTRSHILLLLLLRRHLPMLLRLQRLLERGRFEGKGKVVVVDRQRLVNSPRDSSN